MKILFKGRRARKQASKDFWRNKKEEKKSTRDPKEFEKKGRMNKGEGFSSYCVGGDFPLSSLMHFLLPSFLCIWCVVSRAS